MKKSTSTFIFCFISLFLFAQDYSVTFSATGESTTVSAVTVENLTQNKNLTMNGSDVLRLKGTITSISDLEFDRTEIHFFPNPMEEFSLMEFNLPEEGDVIIELFEMTGRKLVQIQNYLNAGRHSFKIEGLNKGIHVLKVKTGSYLYSGKLISNKTTKEMLKLTYQNTVSFDNNISALKNAYSEKQMQYNNGDVLMFRANGGIHKAVVVQSINQSKNIEFPFYECTDPDNRNYATIKIGNQVWMAENYAYLPSISSSAASSSSQPHYYVYGNTFKTVPGAKSLDNYKTYGVLYNWPAAKAVLKPSGWHLPSMDELEALEKYLKNNGFSDGGTIIDDFMAKSLAATSNWNTSSIPYAIGNNLSANNKSGFSALPGGLIESGVYKSKGESGYWWTSYESNVLSIITVGYYLLKNDYKVEFHKLKEMTVKSNGLSIRYIKY